MTGLTFDPKNHVYKYDGVRKHSVTQILRAVGYTDHSAPWFTDESRELGSYLHDCIHAVNDDDLILDSVDERVRPEVEAYIEWKERTGYQPIFSERRLYSKAFDFAGTLDTFGKFKGKDKGHYSLVDIKRGGANKATRYQTALYTILVCENHETTIYPFQIRRYALQGFSSGRPKIIQYEDKNDITVAKAILTTFHAGVDSGIYKITEG